MYVYIKSEPQLWTTGFYAPDGKWQPDEDFDQKEEAAKRVAWLNGSQQQGRDYYEQFQKVNDLLADVINDIPKEIKSNAIESAVDYLNCRECA